MNVKDLRKFVESQPWYNQWLSNIVAQNRSVENILECAVEYSKCYYVITTAFSWHETPEGANYWAKIAKDIKDANLDLKNANSPKRFEYFKEERLVAIIDVKNYDADKPMFDIKEDIIDFLKGNGIKYTKLEFDCKDECFKAYVETSGFREC